MRAEFFESISESVKNWWISLLIGILFVIGAFILIFNPIESYGILSIAFAIFMFIEGVFEIIFAFSNKNILPGWGWYFALGVFTFLLGLLLILHPSVTEAIIPFILAFWLLIRGFSMIGASIELHQFGNRNWGWYLALGVLSVLCAVGIFFFPIVGAFSVIYILAFIFLFLGIARILLAFELKSLHKDCARFQKKMDAYNKKNELFI